MGERESDAGNPEYSTFVFKFNLRKMKDNPFLVDTPYGKPVATGIGNAFDACEGAEDDPREIASSIKTDPEL